mmetsp:Transcript_4236/g.5463  ORF Transcript_4236/g.5463 Transcript_4236/m.5463 type:complete len:130 (+) Transcript_4236:203-592(+)
MQLTKTMLRARNLLVDLLLFIAAGESCWYTINGDIDHDYSLARRLGFNLKEDYYAFLIVSGLASRQINKRTEEKEMIINTEEWHSMINASLSTDEEDRSNTTKKFEMICIIEREEVVCFGSRCFPLLQQ